MALESIIQTDSMSWQPSYQKQRQFIWNKQQHLLDEAVLPTILEPVENVAMVLKLPSAGPPIGNSRLNPKVTHPQSG